MSIQKISDDNINLIPENMNVKLIGDVNVSYIDNKFKYKIIKDENIENFIFPTSKPNNLQEFNSNRYGFIFTENDLYVGHTVVEHKFNNTLYIEDFDICSDFRGKKYAKELMNFLEDHAKKSKLKGISLEVQNNNVIAFLFYIKCGFVIGGLDSLFYEKTRQNGETAIYLYKFFNI